MDRSSSTGARIRDVLSFAVSLAAAVLLLNRVLPKGVNDLLDDKLEHLARHPADYDTLMLGSSVVYRAYDPAIFDATTRAEGFPTRSYNLGVQGFHMVDLIPVVEELEGLDLPELRWVIVHAGELIGKVDITFPLTNKSVAWHDLPSTQLAFEQLSSAELTPKQRLMAKYRHVLAMGYRSFNVGRGTGPLSRLLGLGTSAEGRRELLGEGELGYRPPDDDHSANNLRQRENFVRIIDRYVMRLTRYTPPPADGSSLGPRAKVVVLRLDAAIRALGAQPVYVTGAHLPLEPGLVDACVSGIVGPTLRFDEPTLHPEVYLPQHHYDRAHLNRAGGKIFSELVAREFARLAPTLERSSEEEAEAAPPR